MSKFLVTGSSGTVGTVICQRLLREGHECTGVDLKPNAFDTAVAERTILADMRDKAKVLKSLPRDCDAVLHIGAHARVPHSVKDPSLARDNIESTFNMLEFARQSGIRRFLFASSKDVYGNFEETSEDAVRIACCESPYGASKLASEALIFAYEKCYGLEFSILRLSNVYGRYSEADRVIPIFIRLCRENKPISIHGAGKTLDFIHVDDLADAFMLVLTQWEQVKNEVFNVASGEGISLLEMANQIRNRLGARNEITVKDSGRGDVVQSVSNISKIRNVLGFAPKTNFQTGIQSEITQAQ